MNHNSIIYHITYKAFFMKKILFIFGFLLVTIMLITCSKDTDDVNGSKILKYAKTLPGGCNGETFNDLKSASVDEDTLIFTVRDDTLDAYIGINYICCAPFASEVRVTNDSIIMIVSDTCPDPYHSCYCRCMCYYTWDFLFTDIKNTECYFKVILNDPRAEEPIIFKEGVLEIHE